MSLHELAPVVPRTRCVACDACETRPFLRHPDGEYVACSRCGLVRAEPLPSDAELEARAEYWSERHHLGDAKLGRQFDPAYQGVAYGDLLDRLSPYRQGGHLLEVGCAVGGFLDAASRRGWQALGIELAEPLARHARESRGLDVRQGTVDTVDIEPGSCDVAVLLDVIEHVIDPKALLARLGVFVRRGDALLLLTPNVSGLGARCLGPAWEAYGPKDHARLFNARTLTSICRAAGFDVRRHWTIDVNPLPFLARLCRSARRLLASKPRAETDGRRALQARDRLISRIYASRLLRLVRRTFNLLLRPTGLGEKLHVLAERR